MSENKVVCVVERDTDMLKIAVDGETKAYIWDVTGVEKRGNKMAIMRQGRAIGSIFDAEIQERSA